MTRRGELVAGLSLMSSAWRGTGIGSRAATEKAPTRPNNPQGHNDDRAARKRHHAWRQKAWPRKGSIPPPYSPASHEKRERTAMVLSARLASPPPSLSLVQAFLNTVR